MKKVQSYQKGGVLYNGGGWIAHRFKMHPVKVNKYVLFNTMGGTFSK